MKNVKLLIISLLISSSIVQSQDAHYWNIAYGTKATLLGGSVIGSVNDLSAAFYNPGMLGLRENAELVLGARVFELSTLSLKAFTQNELTSKRFRPSPSFFAGTFMSDSTKNYRFTYSIFTRQYFDFSLENRNVKQFETNQIDNELIFLKDMNETWGGFTYSLKVHPNIGLGISQFLIYRGTTKRFEFSLKNYNEQNQLESYNSVSSYYFYNVRTLLKIGIGIEKDDYTAGLTITTPSINLFGSGDAYYSNSAINFENFGGAKNDYLAADEKQGITSKYKNSWAVGIGASYKILGSKIHISSEWYNGVRNYEILSVPPFKSQDQNHLINYSLTNEAKSIINYGFGYELKLIEGISSYASFVTDYSTIPEGTSTNSNFAKWNIYHFSLGASFAFLKTEITTGFEYAFGKKNGLDFNSNAVAASRLLEEVATTSEVIYNRYKFVLVFNFFL